VEPEWTVVDVDMSEITAPGETTLDALARLQLTARRFGATVHVHNACPLLADLIEVSGLGEVLIVVVSGVDVQGQTEAFEQRGVDEEVHRGDRLT
jgi:hypothetical protein